MADKVEKILDIKVNYNEAIKAIAEYQTKIDKAKEAEAKLNNVANSLPTVTKQLPTYTLKNTRMITAAMVEITPFLSWKRLAKKSGMVMASSVTTE